MRVRNALFGVLLLGCRDVEPPPPQPPAPPPVVVVPPTPLPPPVIPPVPPPVPPPRDTLELVVFPYRLTIPVGEVQFFCTAWRFPTGRIAMRRHDEVRSVSAHGRSCAEMYRITFLEAEQRVTPEEQAAVEQLTRVTWGTEDTNTVTVPAVQGGIQSAPRFRIAWVAWAQAADKRGLGLVDSTYVVTMWRGQIVRHPVTVIAYGWFVAPEGTPCAEGSPGKPWDLKTALSGGRPSTCAGAIAAR